MNVANANYSMKNDVNSNGIVHANGKKYSAENLPPKLAQSSESSSSMSSSSSGQHPSTPSAKQRVRRSQRDIIGAQQTLYKFLLDIVKNWEPDDVIKEFRHLFIEHVNASSEGIIPALYEIVFANNEQEFYNTLKRSCYILINNWEISRNHDHIQQLVRLFHDPILERTTLSPTLKRLRGWIRNFAQSPDFQELELFASRYDDKDWSQRYVSYLLVPQYVNIANPVEQREAAKTLSRQLKEQFKYELAMYTASADQGTPSHPTVRSRANPTYLGDDALRMVKLIVARRGKVSYQSLARVFLQQTYDLPYNAFKQSLLNYLIHSVGQPGLVANLRQTLATQLEPLYESYNSKIVDEALRLRTCNRVIEFLTTENREEPSNLFALLLSEGTPLTLVVMLLKLILISRYSKTHLETRIAELIRYYSTYSEDDCDWVINFLEIFRITMTIHAENVEYNLVSVLPELQLDNPESLNDLDRCRIFSQLRHGPAVGDLSEAEIVEHLLELSADSELDSNIDDSDG